MSSLTLFENKQCIFCATFGIVLVFFKLSDIKHYVMIHHGWVARCEVWPMHSCSVIGAVFGFSAKATENSWKHQSEWVSAGSRDQGILFCPHTPVMVMFIIMKIILMYCEFRIQVLGLQVAECRPWHSHILPPAPAHIHTCFRQICNVANFRRNLKNMQQLFLGPQDLLEYLRFPPFRPCQKNRTKACLAMPGACLVVSGAYLVASGGVWWCQEYVWWCLAYAWCCLVYVWWCPDLILELAFMLYRKMRAP